MNVLIFLSATKETCQNQRVVRYYSGPRETVWNGTYCSINASGWRERVFQRIALTVPPGSACTAVCYDLNECIVSTDFNGDFV